MRAPTDDACFDCLIPMNQLPRTQPKAAVHLRAAEPADADRLGDIAFAAKAHWGYAAPVLERWRDDLRVSPQSLREWPTRVAEVDGRIAGFAQLEPETGVDAEATWALAHLWIDPPFMRRGIGRALLADVLTELQRQGARRLSIDADPNAEAFYRSCGAVRTGTIAAPIDGDPGRQRPQLRIDLPVTAP